MTQSQRIARALKMRGPRGITPLDFIGDTFDGGTQIMRVAARVQELRDRGLTIENVGGQHAIYVLRDPEGGENAPESTPTAPGHTPVSPLGTAPQGAILPASSGTGSDTPDARCGATSGPVPLPLFADERPREGGMYDPYSEAA